MNKYINLLFMVTAFGCAGCASKKTTKVSHDQKDAVVRNIVQDEQSTDSKEDYSIVA